MPGAGDRIQRGLMKFLTSQQMLISALMQKLHNSHVWCGEFVLQKAVYIAKSWLDVFEFNDYEFIMYMNCAYSYDLKRELQGMKSDGVIEFNHNDKSKLGAPLVVTKTMRQVLADHDPIDLRPKEFDFLKKHLSRKTIVQMEGLTRGLMAVEKVGVDSSSGEKVKVLTTTWKTRLPEKELFSNVVAADKFIRFRDKFMRSI